MRVISANAFNKLDHQDVKDQAGNTESQRRKYRVKIIKKFMSWARKQDQDRFNIDFESSHIRKLDKNIQTEKNILNKQAVFNRYLTGFGCMINFFLYQAAFTGIYNYRTTELINMRRVPLFVKLGGSSLITFSMCYMLYNDSLYDEQLYALALKYRQEYDG